MSTGRILNINLFMFPNDLKPSSGVVPTIHIAITDGVKWMFEKASFHWLMLMGALYLLGATVYCLKWCFHLKKAAI